MPESIDTKGGTVVQDSVHTDGGDFIGRDQNIRVDSLVGLDDAHQDRLVALISELCAGGGLRIEVDADHEHLSLSGAGAGASRVTLGEDAANDLLGVAARYADPRVYLSALMINPRYRRWGEQFVALAGTLTEQKQVAGWTVIDPEFAELEVSGEGAQRQIRRIRLADIADAVERHSALVLLGEPGSGKTTVLERLLLDAAGETLAGNGHQLPLFLPLADYHDHATPQDFVAARWRSQVGTEDCLDQLGRGRLLLLCDALNEMPFADQQDYRKRVAAWRRWVADLPAGNTVVFTCRSLDYSESLSLPQVEISRLDDGRIRDFMHRYLDSTDPDLADSAWARLDGSELVDLVRNPWYLKMLVWLLATGEGWPEGRAGLFRQFVARRLLRERDRGHPEWPGEEALQSALAILAEAMQPLGEGTRLPRPEALRKLPKRVRCESGTVETPPESILRLGLAATLLDTTEPGEGGPQIKFYHHQLQEYFAALRLVQRHDEGEDLSSRWKWPRSGDEMPDSGPLREEETLPPPPTTGWEEPTVLAAGLAADRTAFPEALRRANPVLAARCLTEPGIEAPGELRQAVQADLLAVMADPQTHLRARLVAGEALGSLGDPRFERVSVGATSLRLPPMVGVPAGTAPIGSRWWEVRLGGGFADERPRHQVALSDFSIGVYPVTNAEFRCFVDDGGYSDLCWWQSERARAWVRGELENEALEDFVSNWKTLKGDPSRLAQLDLSDRMQEQWTQLLDLDEATLRKQVADWFTGRPMDRPAFWDDERYNRASQPVVGVTWFEAGAYCVWLTERWRSVADSCPHPLPDGVRVRLPTEAEWERAVRYPRARRYPWGTRWNSGFANTEEGHVRRPSPVGVYPEGATPAGILDLAGNVWEWTESLYRPYPIRAGDARDDPEEPGFRVLRGGSWYDNRWYARCAVRVRSPPDLYFTFSGFRVVLSLADSGS